VFRSIFVTNFPICTTRARPDVIRERPIRNILSSRKKTRRTVRNIRFRQLVCSDNVPNRRKWRAGVSVSPVLGTIRPDTTASSDRSRAIRDVVDWLPLTEWNARLPFSLSGKRDARYVARATYSSKGSSSSSPLLFWAERYCFDNVATNNIIFAAADRRRIIHYRQKTKRREKRTDVGPLVTRLRSVSVTYLRRYSPS